LRRIKPLADSLQYRQRKLLDTERCFFYITNDWELSAEEVVLHAHRRCNQENLIEQQKNGVRSLTANPPSPSSPLYI